MMDDDLTDGEVSYGDRLAVIRFERHLLSPPAVVWVALTDREFMAKWWGEVTLDARLGGKFDVCWFNRTEAGDRFTMHATITEFNPPHLLETNGDLHGVLRWELSAERSGTKLVFTSALDLPEGFRAKTLAGWHFHLLALRHALAGERPDLVGLPEWPAIHARYEAKGAGSLG
jgi:uncharacterized protein YndB with AHSA1/START domain